MGSLKQIPETNKNVHLWLNFQCYSYVYILYQCAVTLSVFPLGETVNVAKNKMSSGWFLSHCLGHVEGIQHKFKSCSLQVGPSQVGFLEITTRHITVLKRVKIFFTIIENDDHLYSLIPISIYLYQPNTVYWEIFTPV